MKQQRFLHSTYARTVISALKVLAGLFQKYSIKPKETAAFFSGIPNLLNIIQIDQALANPQNTLKTSMAAYANLIKFHRNIIATREQADLQRRLARETIAKLRAKFNSAANEVQKEELSESIATLESSQKKTTEMQKELLALESKIQSFQDKLDFLTQKCDEDWEKYRDYYLKELIAELGKAGIELTDLEKQELTTQDTWPEILKRFETLSLEIPAYLNTEEPNFATYFKLKAYLIIHASLSRRMLPMNPDDILKILRQLPRD